MAAQPPRYDVAISFLSQDEAIAVAVRDRLSEGLNVFFYPRNQEKLAGTDGLETMRTPFLSDSRVVVVLFREPWGKTPWTGVEQTAIQESCLNQGWHRLFFVILDRSNALPIWLPQNHVRFNYEDFGLEQAIGAIKARVQECGGKPEPMTALKRAALYDEEKKYQADRSLINSDQGMQVVGQNLDELFGSIEQLCKEINDSKKAVITVGVTPRYCVIRNHRVSLTVGWRQPYSNTIEGCGVAVAEFNAQVPLPNTREFSVSEPTRLDVTTYVPELSRAREYGWVEKGEAGPFLSSPALADKCVIQFLDLAARADRGEVPEPKW